MIYKVACLCVSSVIACLQPQLPYVLPLYLTFVSALQNSQSLPGSDAATDDTLLQYMSAIGVELWTGCTL